MGELEVKGLTCGKTSPECNHQPPVNSQTGPWVHDENVERTAQNNNDGEVPQIKEEQEFVVHPHDAEALHVRNKSEASKFPGDRLDPGQDLRQCEGPGDVDQGITNFLDF